MKANCEAGETETNAHIGHAYLPTYVWRPTHPVASLFSASFSSIIIIYILFTVNAHRFLHPYAKETESNHFTMLHPFRMCMWLLLNCIVGGKSPSFPLLCRLPVVLATLTFFLAWIIFSALSLSLIRSFHARFTFIHLLPLDIFRWWIHIIHKMISGGTLDVYLKHPRIRKMEIFSSLLYYICHFVQSFSVRWWAQHECRLLSFASKRKPLYRILMMYVSFTKAPQPFAFCSAKTVERMKIKWEEVEKKRYIPLLYMTTLHCSE